MGLTDFLPWKKKEEPAVPRSDSFNTESFGQHSSPQDPLAPSAGQSADPFADPGSRDPFSQQQDDSDPFSIGPQHGASQANYSMPSQSRRPQRSFPQQEPQQEYDVPPSRDMELVLAKLDAIKAELDSLHQRVRKIEGATDGHGQQRRYTW